MVTSSTVLDVVPDINRIFLGLLAQPVAIHQVDRWRTVPTRFCTGIVREGVSRYLQPLLATTRRCATEISECRRSDTC